MITTILQASFDAALILIPAAALCWWAIEELRP
jgi:hypothetical protein